ncbi:hypothetical protein N658DRAFT_71020 [Parathielavia hyrcaniae]|uniref:Uncharacterized protein n=1 Tax=Parathielavia hyrcaniae TaxID=113614 RepID=A0AAN6Q0P2_9PEZI|nr:hypothetical protein N658DRAFT_71020 [Parathielavia hyrcaniae]
MAKRPMALVADAMPCNALHSAHQPPQRRNLLYMYLPVPAAPSQSRDTAWRAVRFVLRGGRNTTVAVQRPLPAPQPHEVPLPQHAPGARIQGQTSFPDPTHPPAHPRAGARIDHGTATAFIGPEIRIALSFAAGS